jgi:phage minor structural protein
MAELYIYAPDCGDFSTIGVCGRLTPSRYEWDGAANCLPEIVVEHPIDPMGRYALIQEEWIIKAPAPVRTMPEIENGSYVTSVEVWTVASTASKAERYVYSRREEGEKKKLLKKGRQVAVVRAPANSDRWKIKAGDVCGWIAVSALTSETTVTIPDDGMGIEEVAPSWEMRDQLFRIYSVNKTDDRIIAYARAIAGDAKYNLTTYDTSQNVGLQAALDGVLNHTLDMCFVEGITNISGERAGAHYRDMNPISAILHPENGLAARWNAEVLFDDYAIYLLDHAGGNRGVRVEYAKNLAGIDMDVDIDDVVTHVRPIGQKKNGSPLYLAADDGLVACPNADNYAFQRIYPLDVDDAAVTDEVSESVALARLSQAANDFIASGIDMPSVNARVNFETIGNAPRFEQYRGLQRVFLYDTITIYHPRLNINMLAQVSRVKWDGLREKIIDMEMGDMMSMTPSISAWQITGRISGSRLIPGSVSSSRLGDGSISARHIQADSISTDALQAGSVTARTIAAHTITAEQIAAGVISAESIEAVRAHIEELVSEHITTDELYAALATIAVAQITTAHIQSANIDWASIQNLTAQIAQIATAQIGTASIQQANIDWAQITSLNAQIAAIADAHIGNATITTAQISDLTAQIASVVTLAAQNGDFNFARVQSLVAGAMILSQGVGDSVYIDNLAATSAMLAQATLGELVLKGSNGNYYEVTCEADGTLRTRQVTVSAAEIAAGQTSAGKAIVATNANITALNAQTIKAKSAVISQIMAAAIEAEQITAGQAFIAMAEIPQLATTAISALGEALTIRGEHVRIESAGASQSLETVLTRLRGDAETAMQTLSGLGVGGVNLVDDSDVITITGTDDTSTSFRRLANDLEPGRTYTLSMASATLLQGSAAGMTLGVYKRKDGTASPILWKVLDFTGGRQKYTFTTPADGDSYFVNLFAGIRGASNGVVVEVTKVKLEEGTFATTWTPSTADAEVPLADLRTTLETYPGGFGALVEHVQGDLDGAASDLYSFFRFYDDNGEPHLEMGSSNSAMKMDLSNSRLSFRMGTLEVAYFSDNKLYVTNVEAIERLSVGTPQNGYLEMVTTETGVGFMWRS